MLKQASMKASFPFTDNAFLALLFLVLRPSRLLASFYFPGPSAPSQYNPLQVFLKAYTCLTVNRPFVLIILTQHVTLSTAPAPPFPPRRPSFPQSHSSPPRCPFRGKPRVQNSPPTWSYRFSSSSSSEQRCFPLLPLLFPLLPLPPLLLPLLLTSPFFHLLHSFISIHRPGGGLGAYGGGGRGGVDGARPQSDVRDGLRPWRQNPLFVLREFLACPFCPWSYSNCSFHFGNFLSQEARYDYVLFFVRVVWALFWPALNLICRS